MKQFILLLLVPILAFSDIGNNWQISVSKEQIGETADLSFENKISDGWYMYGTEVFVEDGPIKTKIEFDNINGFELVDNLIAIDPIQKYDEVWDGTVTIFKKQAKFVQKIKLLKAKVKVSGRIVYQMCNEKDGNCVLKKDPFTIFIK